MATTATVIRITAMVTATPLTAMATRLMAMVMGPAIMEVTDTAYRPVIRRHIYAFHPVVRRHWRY